MDDINVESRRRLLKFIAGSPLVALWLKSGGRQDLFAYSSQDTADVPHKIIASVEEALNVFDFEPVARTIIPPAHWGYLATGVDDDLTLRANRSGFSRFQIRPRRLVDVTKIDTSIELFGEKWKTPIVIAPVGGQRAFHSEGELATANAARTRGHLQILSTVSTTSIEDVMKARGAPVWYQLYPTPSLDITNALIKRAESAGAPVLVLTVDLPAGRNTETQSRYRLTDTRTCSACHQPGFTGRVRRLPMFDKLDVSNVPGIYAPGLTWDFVKRLKDSTKMKLVLKGIVTKEDAALSVQHGVDAIIVSNHGGRAEESGRSTIECLPEVIEGASGRIPVLIDGGFRRGTDVFKALALGAKAVCIGRPYLWGLGAFGQPGVEKVLDILRSEFELIMRQAGTISVDRITSSYVTDGFRRG